MRTQTIASVACLLVAGMGFGKFLSAAEPAGNSPGKAAYQRICVNCHGEPTEGGDGPALVPMFHDPQEVLSIVRSGQAKMLPIPPEKISDEDVLAVVDYLTQLTSKQ